MKLLGIEHTFDGGVEKTWLHTDRDGKDVFTTERVIDVEPVLKRNAEQFNSDNGSFLRGDMHKVASIPGVVIESLARQKGIPFSEAVQGKTDRAQSLWNELLNGREFRAFRTKPGQVDVKRGLR